MNHVFHCTGLCIFRWGRWRAELWFVPSDAEILDHYHRHLDAWIMLLWGVMIWRRDQRQLLTVAPTRPIRVLAGQRHGASARRRSIFLTIEHWMAGAKIWSAAHDLVIV